MIIRNYFPELTDHQLGQFGMLNTLYTEWNARVNLVSRNDMVHLEERHILHSLAIAKFIRFQPGTRVMDLGTGGGFPGIPLAIFFPATHFLLVDSIGKKIKVVDDIIRRLGLTNAHALCERAEKVEDTFDFVVSRATAPLSDLYKWSRKRISPHQANAIPNGIICLKGGDLSEELKPFLGRTEVVELSGFFSEFFFQTKKLVYLAC